MKKAVCKIGGAENFEGLKGPIIYGIVCTANQRIYVGQTVNPRSRINRHLRDLVLGVHDNCPLQNSWKKYGPSNFQLVVLERVEGSLDDAERRWFDRYSELLFNVLLNPGEQPRTDTNQPFTLEMLDQAQLRKLNGRKAWDQLTDEEQRRLLKEGTLPHDSQTQLSLEVRQAIKEKRQKRWAEQPFWTEERRKALGKTYTLESPDGEIIEFTGLRLFADKHGLDEKRLREVANEKAYSHKGWKLPLHLRTKQWKQEQSKIEKPKIYQTFGRQKQAEKLKQIAEARKAGISVWPTLIDPKGQEHRSIVHFSKFCKEQGINSQAFNQVIRNRGTQYLGWKIVYDNPDMIS